MRRRRHGEVHPGWAWGPFTCRLPIYHTRVEWSELFQGIFVAGATSIALVPLLMGEFGLTFEEAIACVMIQNTLIASSSIVFGEPFAGGWVTPALPIALTFVLGGFADPQERFRMMTAITLDLVIILAVLGVTGLGRRLIAWLPNALKGGIIMGAAIASFKRIFVDDAPEYLLQQPISTVAAGAVCLLLAFSRPIQRLKLRSKPVAILAGLGLLPGFAVAALVGPLVGEIAYQVETGFLVPPFAQLWQKAAPFAIGWPPVSYLIQAMPLAFIGYVILFGDLITGTQIVRSVADSRPDEKLDFDVNRTHYSLAIRNFLMALLAPIFPTQGVLWTGVHVIIVQRWKEGRATMDSLFGGISSYYVFGLPVLVVILPFITALKPLMPIALTLTLALTGFACAYVAMNMVEGDTEKGTMFLIATVLALSSPWVGMITAVAATGLLVGFDRPAKRA